MENELTTEKTMTVKEVAEALGVSERTIQNHAKNMGLTQNGKTTYLSQKQCTEIKNSIAESGRNDLANVCEVKNINSEIDIERMTATVLQYHIQRAKHLEQQLSITQPKADVYDAICDSSTLQDLQTVAQTIGITNIFKVLLADGIIKKEWTKDGTLFYRPYADYNDYLVLKDGRPYVVDGVSHVRPRIFVTGKGITWLTKKYGK